MNLEADSSGMPVSKRKSFVAWALYDVASSTYAAVVPGVLMPVYFTSVVAADRPDAQALWGAVASAAVLLAGLVAPFVGAHADLRGRRLFSMSLFTALCCAATAMLPLAQRGDVALAALLFVLAQLGYTLATSIYDAYLERLTPRFSSAEKLSCAGWALGFLGGIAAILIALSFTRDSTETASILHVFSSLPWIALLFAVLAVPALLGLRHLRADPYGGAEHLHPYRRVLGTLRAWRSHREVLRFLLGAYLINDAIVTTIFFIAIYLRDIFHMTVTGLLWLLLLYHLIALPATALFGLLAQRASTPLALRVTLVLWAVAIVLMAFGQGQGAAIAVVVVFATVLGSSQALLRGSFTRLVPPAQATEFFGFNALVSRVSAAVGPLLFGIISTAAGTPKAGLLSLIAFLVAGAFVLSGVRLPASRSQQQEPPPEAAFEEAKAEWRRHTDDRPS